MSFECEFQYYRLVFQEGKLVFASPEAGEFFAFALDKKYIFTWNKFLSKLLPEDRQIIKNKLRELERGILVEAEHGIRIKDPKGGLVSLSVMLDEILYKNEKALRVTLMGIYPNQGKSRLQQETEIMRDVLAALAGADNLQQALEVILVNLHDIIQYDRAALILADEDKRFVLAKKSKSDQEISNQLFLDDDPVVKEIISKQSVLIFPDVQEDTRFDDWPDMESVRGWLAAPLVVDHEIIGILTLGSLKVSAYQEEDAEMMMIFASQVAQVIEKAWLREQRTRRTQDLEVISRISLALGQAESSENTLFEIVERVTNFFDALQGVFLLPDQTGSSLRIEVSQDNSLVGENHELGDDLFWQSFRKGQINGINNVPDFIEKYPTEIFKSLFSEAHSAIIIPLLSDEKVFGLLCFTFYDEQWFSDERMRLANAVAEIAGASIHRAVVLKALERQVDLRTQHLSVLYEINAIASQSLELDQILDRILDITVDSLPSKIGIIHFLDNEMESLNIFSDKNLSAECRISLDHLPLQANFWNKLLNSSNPLVLPDINKDAYIPDVLAQMSKEGVHTYIGVPVRAKGKLLGLLSVFSETISEYAIDDFTLFMTIADEIGGSVERASLMKQAEIAAVVEERQRMARELHDSVTQLLYGQVLFTGASLKQLKQGNQELTIQHLERIDKAALQALKEMRLLIYQLQPSDYLQDGLVAALEKRLDAVEKRTGINVRIVVDGSIKIDSSQELMLYRIAEEALNNTLKHAHATMVDIRIGSRKGKLFLEVSDNGLGFNPDEKKHGGGMGLKNMQKRASDLSGSLNISSEPGEGTRILVELENLKKDLK